MKMNELKAQPLERLIADALRYGTWIASVAIAIGLMLSAAGGYFGEGGVETAWGAGLVKSGIALFIFLPIMRVILMLVAFMRGKDYRMGAVAGLVLAIIVLGCAMGAMQ
jgi:uncharacterized membrane protein